MDIRHLSGEPAYLAFAYHLLFHKSEAVLPGTEYLSRAGWPAKYTEELSRLASDAGKRLPHTFDDLEADLGRAGMMPPLDTIGFYSERNSFLVARYRRDSANPGLSVFLVRNFGIEPDPVAEIRQMIAKEGFEVSQTGSITSADRKALETIRGGNWYDKNAENCLALPFHYFVCINRNPIKPSRNTLKRYPRLDDERLLVKNRIREAFAPRWKRRVNIIHVSDNSAEAHEYILALGLDVSAQR
jgi:hypothetical protein